MGCNGVLITQACIPDENAVLNRPNVPTLKQILGAYLMILEDDLLFLHKKLCCGLSLELLDICIILRVEKIFAAS